MTPLFNKHWLKSRNDSENEIDDDIYISFYIYLQDGCSSQEFARFI